jgi:hypothetical protein
MARNVGVNSTFEQQRLVINELAVDVETLENAGYITDYTEQDNLGTVLSRGNQATSDIQLTGIITATSFVGDGSNLTGISAGAGGTDNVSTSTLTVAGISTFNGRIVGSATTNIIPFLYANLSDLPSATEYHGAFAHVHATGKAYYAHSSAWVELVNIDGGTVTATTFDGDLTGNVTGNADTATNLNGSTYNLNTSGIITATQFVGDGSGLTGVVAEGTGIVIQEEGSSVGTAGTINFIGAGVTATLSNGVASVEITATGGGGGISNVVEDTTPQLGGNLDINNKYITGTGGANITGVVTATRFESTSAGTPTIDSPNNLNINAVTVAISTNLTAGGSVTAASFVGDGSGLTGVVGSGSGVVVQEEGSSVGTAGTINFIGAGVTATFAGGIASVEITSSGGGGAETDTLATVTARGNTTTAEITAANFRSNDTTGDGSDIGFAIKYYITSNGASSYRFAGPGVLNSTDNPTLYFHRGFTYILENSTGSGHPFELRVSNGGAAYAPGGSFLSGSINGTQILTVPFDAPNSIVYQCTLHGSMVGNINIVS